MIMCPAKWAVNFGLAMGPLLSSKLASFNMAIDTGNALDPLLENEITVASLFLLH